MPIVLALIPTLMKVAEGLFSKKDAAGNSTGSLKKEYVMKALELLWDLAPAKLVHDWPNVDEKKLFLRTCEVWIEELVPGL